MRAITDDAFVKKHNKLDCTTQESLKRFLIFLEHAEPRRLLPISGEAWLVFTDAFYEPNNHVWPCGLGGSSWIQGAKQYPFPQFDCRTNFGNFWVLKRKGPLSFKRSY